MSKVNNKDTRTMPLDSLLSDLQSKSVDWFLYDTEACNFIKKRLWHSCFPENFGKFLRTPISQNTSRRLLLKIKCNTIPCSKNIFYLRLIYNSIYKSVARNLQREIIFLTASLLLFPLYLFY